MSELALQRIAENKKNRAKYLDLGNCGLTTLPSELGECVWLEELVLSNIWYEYEEVHNDWSRKESENTGERNRLIAINSVEKLPKLKKIILARNPVEDAKWTLEDLSPLANLSDLLYVDLRNTNVQDLSFAKKLIYLQYFLFSSTPISDISPLQNSIEITHLSLRSTKVDDLSVLSGFSKLVRLSFNDTPVKSLLPLATLDNLKIIHCSSTLIDSLAPLADLKELEDLRFSGTFVQDLTPLSSLTTLKELYFQNTKVDSIAPLHNLIALQKIGFSNTKIADISALSNKILLQELSLSYTEVDSLLALEKLTLISKLNISKTKVSDLTPISKLKSISTLNCAKTAIEDFSPLKSMDKLSVLNCSHTKINNLKALGAIKSLANLNLSCTAIRDLSGLDKLNNLNELDCSSTYIADLSPLKNLENITKINCYKTIVSDLKPLRKMLRLEYLNLSSTQVINLQPLSALHNLKKLHLDKSAVTDLSPIISLIKKGKVSWSGYRGSITVKNCPLIHPPLEIVKQGNAAILNYFEELDRAKANNQIIRLAEAKCLVLGEGGVGKTSLTRKLINADSPMPSEAETTKGIHVHTLELQLVDGTDFRLNIWDFGGQEIYHATHQFFLTKRSLYLLVDDTRKDAKTVNDPVFNYWLQTAQLYGGDSPLLIVQNEKGDRSKQLDLGGMQDRFSFVKDTKATNLLSGRGLADVHTAIQYWLLELPHIGEEQPKAWVDIRRELEQVALEENCYLIPLQRYLQICSKHGISERKRALFLSQYLHDFGAFLHFQDHLLLRRIIVLSNQWATEAVYKVLDSEMVKQNFGRFTEDDLVIIWEEDCYLDHHSELLALMEKFELCYQLPNEKISTWLIPQLLSVIPPPALNWEDSNNLQIGYEYTFMPRGLLSQHIVRMHRYLRHPELAWKSGAVFERGTAKALVTEEWGLRKINIRASGPQAKELLTILSEDFDTMHERLEGLRVKKLIPCNCTGCRNLTEPYFYDYDNLEKRRQVGKLTIECQLSYEDVNVKSLLSGVIAQNMSSKYYDDTKTKVFIAYAKEDRTKQVELLKQLSVLEREISIWYDDLTSPGSHWQDSAKEALRQADIVLYLVTAHSIASQSLKELEFPMMQQQAKNDKCVIVPILVDYCAWENLYFAEHNSLPAQDTPITSPVWQNEAQAWMEVVKGIKRLL